jgi:hypothetical protein
LPRMSRRAWCCFSRDHKSWCQRMHLNVGEHATPCNEMAVPTHAGAACSAHCAENVREPGQIQMPEVPNLIFLCSVICVLRASPLRPVNRRAVIRERVTSNTAIHRCQLDTNPPAAGNTLPSDLHPPPASKGLRMDGRRKQLFRHVCLGRGASALDRPSPKATQGPTGVSRTRMNCDSCSLSLDIRSLLRLRYIGTLP